MYLSNQHSLSPSCSLWPFPCQALRKACLPARSKRSKRSSSESLLGRVENLSYKTIRYPGHYEKLKLLKDCGFFSQEPVEVKGHTYSLTLMITGTVPCSSSGAP